MKIMNRITNTKLLIVLKFKVIVTNINSVIYQLLSDDYVS